MIISLLLLIPCLLFSTTWETPTQIASPTATNTGLSLIRINDSGQAVLGWYVDDVSKFVRLATYDVTNQTWTITNITGSTTTGPSTLSISMNASGQAIATWINIGAQRSVYAVVLTDYDSSSWSTPVHISVNSQVLGPASQQVIISDLGEAVAIWSTGGVRLYAATLTDYTTNTWSPDVQVISNGASSYTVGVGSSGKAIIGCRFIDGFSVKQVAVCQMTSYGTALVGSTWSSPLGISGTLTEVIAMQIGMDRHNKAVIVWSQSISGALSLSAATLDSYSSFTWTRSDQISGANSIGNRISLGFAANEKAIAIFTTVPSTTNFINAIALTDYATCSWSSINQIASTPTANTFFLIGASVNSSGGGFCSYLLQEPVTSRVLSKDILSYNTNTWSSSPDQITTSATATTSYSFSSTALNSVNTAACAYRMLDFSSFPIQVLVMVTFGKNTPAPISPRKYPRVVGM